MLLGFETKEVMLMRHVVRRAIVVSLLGAGSIYAGVMGLGHASAASSTKSPSSKPTATTSPSNGKGSSGSALHHDCPSDGMNSGSSSSSASV